MLGNGVSSARTDVIAALSVGKPVRGRLSAMCRPYSCSNREGWSSGTSTRCSSYPGAICSQAAGAALFRGRPIGVQPRTSWKKAVDRAGSRVARVTCASATIVLLSRLGLCDGCRSPHNSRRLDQVHRGTDMMTNPSGLIRWMLPFWFLGTVQIMAAVILVWLWAGRLTWALRLRSRPARSLRAA